jgi:hypothetical protein
MSGRKTTAAGPTLRIGDELAPMRHWEQGKPTGYTEGTSHLDRAAFRTGTDSAEGDPTPTDPDEPSPAADGPAPDEPSPSPEHEHDAG